MFSGETVYATMFFDMASYDQDLDLMLYETNGRLGRTVLHRRARLVWLQERLRHLHIAGSRRLRAAVMDPAAIGLGYHRPLSCPQGWARRCWVSAGLGSVARCPFAREFGS